MLPVSATIVSVQFWPPIREERLRLPEEVKDSLDSYSKGFETLKVKHDHMGSS